MKMSNFECSLCGNRKFIPFLDQCEDLYLHKPYKVDYVQCMACELVQQNPIPKDVSEFYESYPIHQEKSVFYAFVRRLVMAGVYLPPKTLPPKGKILDFGCGDGWYLAWCKANGLTCVGFEYSSEHANVLGEKLGVDIFSDMSALAAAHPDGFDVITLNFVAEHLTDIRHVFQGLSKVLAPGGTIRYVVPNIASWEYRWFGRSWHSLDAPRHIIFPAAAHAKRLADELSLRYCGESSVPFPNGFGGSLPTIFLGRFSNLLFLLLLPVSILITRLFPGGNKAYVLVNENNINASA